MFGLVGSTFFSWTRSGSSIVLDVEMLLSDGSKIPSLVSRRIETMDEIRNEFSHLRFVFDNLNRCTIGLITGEKFFAMINIL